MLWLFACTCSSSITDSIFAENVNGHARSFGVE
jgi:hypothetical protein